MRPKSVYVGVGNGVGMGRDLDCIGLGKSSVVIDRSRAEKGSSTKSKRTDGRVIGNNRKKGQDKSVRCTNRVK